MYAVIRAGGKQYRVAPGDVIRVEKLGSTPPKPAARRGAEAEFTSSSGGVRAPSVNAKKELSDEERLEAAPSRVK